MGKWLLALALAISLNGFAGDASPDAAELQQRFNQKYRDYLTPESQALLPFPALEMAEWNKLLAGRPLQVLYREPGKYYNNKVYTFTLYRAEDGAYYLDAKGGFWGMDELAYGPLTLEQLQ